MIIGWILCFVLTAVGWFTDDPKDIGFYARTDAKMNAMYTSKWFTVPYPGRLYIRQHKNELKIFTGPTYNLLLSFTAILNVYMPYIPNTFTKYCLTQWISI